MSAVLGGAYPEVHSTLILKDGRLVVEEYTYGYQRDQLHSVQSCTKSVTSILIGQALDQRLIPGLDTPVYEFFPERKGHRWIDERYPITLKHLLTMTAALDWNEEVTVHRYAQRQHSHERERRPRGLCARQKSGRRPRAEVPVHERPVDTPGGNPEEHHWPHRRPVRRKALVHPMGITEHTWWSMPDGTCHTGGGLSLRPRDFAKIGLMMLNDGGMAVEADRFRILGARVDLPPYSTRRLWLRLPVAHA